MPLRPAQWVSVPESPGFVTGRRYRAFALTGIRHPACLTGKVNAVRSAGERIADRFAMTVDFSGAAITGPLGVLSCCAGTAPARFRSFAQQLSDVKKQSELI